MASLSLFEMSTEYRDILAELEVWAEEHDGEITDFPLADKLAKLEGSLETKCLNIACLIKERKAEAKAVKDLGQSLVKRGQAIENAAERLKAYLELNVPMDANYKDARAAVKWQGNGGVEPVELMPEVKAEELPEKYRIVSYSMDTAAIREDAAEEEGVIGRVIMDGEKVLAVVKPRGKHLAIR